MVKKRILERYAHTETGDIIIDVAANRVQDLYENYEKVLPYIKKDLEDHLASYLVESVQELGETPFIIRITLKEAPSEDVIPRVKKSLENYFRYSIEMEIVKMKERARASVVLLSIGIAILVLSVWVNRAVGKDPGVTARVIAEGLTVAAWVSLWEALATFLIQWTPHRKRIRLYERLSSAEVKMAERAG